jgi:hypothetical protein
MPTQHARHLVRALGRRAKLPNRAGGGHHLAFHEAGSPGALYIPAVSPWFQGNGISSASSWLAPIPFAEFIEEQMAPCIEAGASVQAARSATDYYIRLATYSTFAESTDLAKLQQSVRATLEV